MYLYIILLLLLLLFIITVNYILSLEVLHNNRFMI